MQSWCIFATDVAYFYLYFVMGIFHASSFNAISITPFVLYSILVPRNQLLICCYIFIKSLVWLNISGCCMTSLYSEFQSTCCVWQVTNHTLSFIYRGTPLKNIGLFLSSNVALHWCRVWGWRLNVIPVAFHVFWNFNSDHWKLAWR